MAIVTRNVHAVDPSCAQLLERLALRHIVLLTQPTPHDEQRCWQALREPESVNRVLLYCLRLHGWDIRLLARWLLVLALLLSLGLLFLGHVGHVGQRTILCRSLACVLLARGGGCR